ncbi:hypothetical protein IE81DRAFT_332084 [Ceraceosorus guamensis]|uniref:Uncharacterized protein n=1 Tax=Ceraceosorus guamensis TaxID=1522189 RepID=A0A316VQC9_9BASI|nr:hypothetical protein IE81DRAFT_332084 [Ceraceosorus guamensis]PWN39807.1 hypothetical protein IE81DRAFT_332084 [Ceraceosorus guamensis]
MLRMPRIMHAAVLSVILARVAADNEITIVRPYKVHSHPADLDPSAQWTAYTQACTAASGTMMNYDKPVYCQNGQSDQHPLAVKHLSKDWSFIECCPGPAPCTNVPVYC